jgi:cytochrome c oxidase subunit 3
MSSATEHTHEEHHSHTSSWPIWVGLGIGAALFSFLLFVKGYTPFGYTFAIGGTALFVFGLGGWIRDMTKEDIHEIKNDIPEEFPNIGFWGMLVFIPSEIFLFGSLFASYFVLKAAGGAEFFSFNGHHIDVLESIIPYLNTIFLVSSSFTLHFAEHYLKQDNTKMFQLMLGITLILGYLFVSGQVIEYYEFITGAQNFTILSGPYGAIFYSLTGLHGLHVMIGAGMLTYGFIGSFLGQHTKNKHAALSSFSIYWHFVDVVWIFLMMVIYLRWL